MAETKPGHHPLHDGHHPISWPQAWCPLASRAKYTGVLKTFIKYCVLSTGWCVTLNRPTQKRPMGGDDLSSVGVLLIGHHTLIHRKCYMLVLRVFSAFTFPLRAPSIRQPTWRFHRYCLQYLKLTSSSGITVRYFTYNTSPNSSHLNDWFNKHLQE